MITILFLAANPTDTARLRLDAESRAIEIALREAEFRDRFRLEKHYAVRVADLPALLLRYQPDILHFSGHGLTDNAILLEDDAGLARPVPAQVLGLLLAAAGRQVRCAVLNACYSHSQAAAMVEQIGCVIGMPSEVGDQTAIAFAAAFYQALGYGQDIKTAFDLGCVQASLAGVDGDELPHLEAQNNAATALRFVHAEIDKLADSQQTEPGVQRSSFSTTVTGGSVGQIVNIDSLEGGLTLGKG